MGKNFPDYVRNEDHALFLLIKKRDKEAFAVIYQKYHRYLYSLALKYLKDTQLAEDAVQHIFVKLWETTQNIEIEINLKNYLYTMIKNYILNQFRNNRESISLSYMNAQTEIAKEEDFEEKLEERELHDFLYKGIDKLPPQKREICKLKLEARLNNLEIADRMGISIHTVKSHYQESIKILRNYFQEIE
ncbi:MAG: RNA polymerase sigma-70 factor [Petrimonas sp.]|uniref:RNA polymerase sigma-70 factor n=1 Tax=Petrimonas sp. TaxID=2023866 RepID=UPI001BD61027|nr:RNA polymerase sigma-70 factor [Petrimonas sp.]